MLDFIFGLFISIILILFFFTVKKNKSVKKIRQSDIHFLIKMFTKQQEVVSNKINNSQLSNRINKNRIDIIIVDDKAYWVDNNIFYEADIIDNRPDMASCRPIDTTNISKNEVDKLLFILDNLCRGLNNDSSSSGN